MCLFFISEINQYTMMMMMMILDLRPLRRKRKKPVLIVKIYYASRGT